MPIPILRNVKRSPKSIAWIVGTVVLAFAVLSLSVLLSDVTRDDVVALNGGIEGSRFTGARVGSFFEVSTDNVAGPLCDATLDPQNLEPRKTEKDIVVINKLGKTLPMLTSWMGALFSPGEELSPTVDHSMTLRVTELSISFESLKYYTRHVLNSMGRCGQFIEERTKSRDVRICPVHRVWKDRNDHIVAVFFDPVAINGCRDDNANCSPDCPNYEDGQFWTVLKRTFDLLELQASSRPGPHVDAALERTSASVTL